MQTVAAKQRSKVARRVRSVPQRMQCYSCYNFIYESHHLLVWLYNIKGLLYDKFPSARLCVYLCVPLRFVLIYDNRIYHKIHFQIFIFNYFPSACLSVNLCAPLRFCFNSQHLFLHIIAMIQMLLLIHRFSCLTAFHVGILLHFGDDPGPFRIGRFS
jgi:hypothetical protein